MTDYMMARSGTRLVDGTNVAVTDTPFIGIYITAETTISVLTVKRTSEAQGYVGKTLAPGMFIPVPSGGSAITLTGQVQLIVA